MNLADLQIGDLETVYKAIDLMLGNERQDYKIALDEVKIRLSFYIKHDIFRDLYTKVSPFALKLMVSQYLKVKNNDMKSCTKHFTIIMGLSCVYIMERRMVEGAGILLLDDIHSH